MKLLVDGVIREVADSYGERLLEQGRAILAPAEPETEKAPEPEAEKAAPAEAARKKSRKAEG